MGPAEQDASVRFRVRIDGQPPGAAHGIDVNRATVMAYCCLNNGCITAESGNRSRPLTDSSTLSFSVSAVEAFAFTFG